MSQDDLLSILTDTNSKDYKWFQIRAYIRSHSTLEILVTSSDIKSQFNNKKLSLGLCSVVYFGGEPSWTASYMTQEYENKDAILRGIGMLSDYTKALARLESGEEEPNARLENILRKSLAKWQVWNFWRDSEVIHRVIGKNMYVTISETL